MNKKIVCWIGDAPNHRALVAKIAARHEVAGIVIDKKLKKGSSAPVGTLWNRIISKIRFRKIDRAWSQLQQYYRAHFSKLPVVPTITVDSINSPEAFEFTKQIEPALVVVSGTSLIKEPLVSMSLPIGIMNLHTGLSPYVKGGPNCTNWCIANDQWALIGNTVFWLSAGIDSGNIITSEITDILREKTLPAIHLKVMEHAHDLYLRAIQYVMNSSAPYPSVPQSSLDKGNLYLTKMWTNKKKKQLLNNLNAEREINLTAEIKTVPLPR